jgi:hypothetical protein
MSPDTLLAEKLAVYRGTFDKACRGLFEPSNGRPNSATPSAAAIGEELRRAVRFIADDFAHEFNTKLAAAARTDPTVQMVADKYEMGSAHVDELDELLAAPVSPMFANLEGDDIEGARGLVEDVWARLEKRIRSKWQAYFVLTFQDVSVERKAARDRKKLQGRFDPLAAEAMARAEAVRRTMPDLAAMRDERPRAMSSWVVVVTVVLLAALGGWLVMHEHGNRTASAATRSEPSH